VEPRVGDTVLVVVAINPDFGDESGFPGVISQIAGDAATVTSGDQRSVIAIKNLRANGEGKWKASFSDIRSG
jgi:hypothetical protein